MLRYHSPVIILFKTTKSSNLREDIAPRTLTKRLPCFTVGTRYYAGVRETNSRPVVWNNINEDSSYYMINPLDITVMTCFHYSYVQFRWSRYGFTFLIAFRTERKVFGISTLS
ncbi:hypothetical protein TNCV_2267991 [Trichonephila clavipes]|nr:hypothetical protein TNCV_2267991 [Trichonephila clavipes]